MPTRRLRTMNSGVDALIFLVGAFEIADVMVVTVKVDVPPPAIDAGFSEPEAVESKPVALRATVPCRTRSANGVYVPAMSTKIIEWSIRFSARFRRGSQEPRWYAALMPYMPTRLAA